MENGASLHGGRSGGRIAVAGDLIYSAVPAGEWARRRAGEQGFVLDAAQEAVLPAFERLRRELTEPEAPLTRLFRRRTPVRGLYLWGGVGRGKSFLMDTFFHGMPIARKRRAHFHRFMQEVHRGLARLQGEAEPVAALAREISRSVRLLCLDEFHITDITDAMLMRRLLEGFIEHGVVLVTTSNFAPAQLYLHGLQREQFLPAIDLIERNFEVVNLDGGADYRLRKLEKAGIYHTEPDADARLNEAFEHISGHTPADEEPLEIEGRTIQVRRQAPGVAWFDFRELCEGPRGKPDYIELARRYHTVLVSGVPRFRGGDADKLRRFVWLVDEFYDRRVKLVLGAEVPAADLIAEEDAADRFQANLNVSLRERLTSRLTEMQTRAYLSEPHLA